MSSNLIQKSVNRVLSVLWRLRGYLSALERNRAIDNLGARAGIDAGMVDAMNLESSARGARWIRARLKRYPYWLEGHRLLALNALSNGDAALAYGSARATEKLASSSAEVSAAKLLIGKSLLQAGEAQRALSVLREIDQASAPLEAKEDMAACHLALESYREAYSLLAEIGEERLSPSALEAYRFLRGKIQD